MPDDVSEAEAGEDKPSRSRLRRPLLLAAPILVIVGALYFYLTGGRYESTDNASLQTGLVGIAADVSGKVTEVDVRENQFVHAGQVLFRIASDVPQTAVSQAEAQVAAARTQIGSKQADYQSSLADVKANTAKLIYARAEAARQRALLASGISSRAQYDQAVTAVRTNQNAVEAAQAKAESLKAELGGTVGGTPDTRPAVRAAQAALEQARIALGRTVVRAPEDGIVTRVNQLQVGSYVTAARPVFTLAGTRFWIEANYKESQLRYMRVGQPAEISIDAFPDHKLRGHVASFSPGTGSSFSVLPPENATGNWVKVVQRLPVEIAIDNPPRDLPLHAGLSVSVSVDTGHQRHLLGPDTPPSAPRGAAGTAVAVR